MARVYWTEKAEESVREIGRYVIEQTQSRNRRSVFPPFHLSPKWAPPLATPGDRTTLQTFCFTVYAADKSTPVDRRLDKH